MERDRKKLQEHLSTEDPFQLILRGHLYVDHGLTRLLEEALVRPAAMRLDRASFDQKLDLAVAIGLLTEAERAPFGRLNALRNRVAHDLDAEVGAADERDIWNCTPAHFKAGISNVMKDEPALFPSRLSHLIAFLYFSATARAERLRDQRQENEAAMEKIRAIMKEDPYIADLITNAPARNRATMKKASPKP